MKRNYWTSNMIDRARMLRGNGATYNEIDAALGVPRNSTHGKLSALDATPAQKEKTRQQFRQWTQRTRHYRGDGVKHQPVKSVKLDPETLAERDARSAAADRRTLSQAICGDPPPGYSALDQKNGSPCRSEAKAGRNPP